MLKLTSFGPNSFLDFTGKTFTIVQDIGNAQYSAQIFLGCKVMGILVPLSHVLLLDDMPVKNSSKQT